MGVTAILNQEKLSKWEGLSMMVLKNVVNKTSKPVTKNELVKELRELGVENTELLIVYSDLKSFNFIIGGAQAVIEAIYEVTGYHTTVIMPSHRLDQVCPMFFDLDLPAKWHDKIKKHTPAYDVDLSPIESDEVAKIFAMGQNTSRSAHPVTSFIASGRKAEWYLNKHALNSMLGEGSPLQKLYAQDAKVLCLGVDYEQLTALHLAEYFANCREKVKHEAVMMQNGKRKLIEFEDLALDSSSFNELGKAYEKEVEIKKSIIGGATCRLIDYPSLIDFGVNYLK